MKLDFNKAEIEDFCRRYKLKEFSLFGSAVRGEMIEGSDVDVLIDFDRGLGISLFDLVRMQDELSKLFGNRQVDLITRRGLARSNNPYRKQGILNSLKRIYVA